MPRLTPKPIPAFDPLAFHLFTGEQIPDPITFAVSPKWLNRPQLYPRQATMLKVIFLRDDLFTEYDHMVIDEWESSFRRTGDNGITPGVRERITFLKAQGHPWFREVLLVLGRRAGKGFLSALCMAYVLWMYMSFGDPQGHFGVARDKRLACFIYAGKKEQARENLWRDLINVIIGGPCFEDYISKPMGESLSVYAPHDFVRMKKLADRGIDTAADMATFLIEPKEATMMSGRGPASFMQGYDEMAHQVSAGGAARSAEEIYTAATPALDQFKKYAFIMEPSSPWQMIGQFFTNWKHCLELDESGNPLYPSMLMLQLASWEMYYDWQDAHMLPLFPDGFEGDLGEYKTAPHPQLIKLKGAIQVYDDEMKKLEKSNPETFKVERLSKWQTTQDAYLDPHKIQQMFEPFEFKGETQTLEMTTSGPLSIFYKGHADPSLANANFGVAIAHPEYDEDGTIHCVFDYIHHWRPADFPDNIIDYVEIEGHLWRLIEGFKPDEFTFDQWNSASSIAKLNQKVRQARMPKRVQIFEKTATAKHNWERAENFKIALNNGWIHAPAYEQAELELRFLQLKNGNKVEKQDSGPVQTKDVADTLMECVWTILGEQVGAWTHGALSKFGLDVHSPGGFNPYERQISAQDEAVISGLSGFNRSSDRGLRGGSRNSARNAMRRGRR